MGTPAPSARKNFAIARAIMEAARPGTRTFADGSGGMVTKVAKPWAEPAHSNRECGCTNLGASPCSKGPAGPGGCQQGARHMGSLSASQFVDLMVGGLAIGCVYSLVAARLRHDHARDQHHPICPGRGDDAGGHVRLTSLWLLPVLPLLLVAVGMASSGLIAVAMELAVYRTLRRRLRADHERHHCHGRHVDPVHQCRAHRFGIRAAALFGAVRHHRLRVRRRAHLAPAVLDHGDGRRHHGGVAAVPQAHPHRHRHAGGGAGPGGGAARQGRTSPA